MVMPLIFCLTLLTFQADEKKMLHDAVLSGREEGVEVRLMFLFRASAVKGACF